MSKGSCSLAVWALAWLQVCQGVQKLDVFPSCSCQGLGLLQSTDQDELKNSGSLLYKTKCWTTHSTREHPQSIQYMYPASCWKTASTVVSWKSNRTFFFPKLFRIFLHVSHIIFLLETVLDEAKLSSSFTQVPSQSAPVASTECDFKFQGTQGTCWSASRQLVQILCRLQPHAAWTL